MSVLQIAPPNITATGTTSTIATTKMIAPGTGARYPRMRSTVFQGEGRVTA